MDDQATGRKETLTMIKNKNEEIIGVGAQHNNVPVDNEIVGWIFKLNKEGALIWERQIPYPDSPLRYAEFHNLTQTKDGGYIMTGFVNDTFPAGSLVVNNINTWLVKVDSFGCLIPGCHLTTAVEEVETIKKTTFNIYPIPASTHLFISIENNQKTADGKFRIISATGIVKKTFSLADIHGPHLVTINDLQDGIYFLQYYNDKEELVETKKIIIASHS